VTDRDDGRGGRYERLHNQLRELIEGTSPGLVSAMSTICAVLHAKMPHHFWTGFYFVTDSGALHVGPYQGPLACQVLEGRGVCVRASTTKRPIVVPDVRSIPDHVSCDKRSRSEIAIPLLRDEKVVAVFDVDSDEPDQFSEADVAPLTRILSVLGPFL